MPAPLANSIIEALLICQASLKEVEINYFEQRFPLTFEGSYEHNLMKLQLAELERQIEVINPKEVEQSLPEVK